MIARTPPMVVPWIAASALAATTCEPPREVLRNTATRRTEGTGLIPAEIRCAAEPTSDGRIIVRYQIRNVGLETIHILDGRHMPYQLALDPTTLVILHGVNPPEPGKLYNMIDIPLTRPLAAGQRFGGEVVLPTGTLRDHFRRHPIPASLAHGTIQVRCEVGWGVSPITAANRLQMTMPRLLAWQQIARYGPISVTLP